jgi:Tol biopolymer transport system component
MKAHPLVGAALAAGLALLGGACAGDGGQAQGIFFVSTRDGDYAIYAMDAAGGGQTRVTDSESNPSSPRGLFFQIDPAPSPDGGKIAFASKRGGTFDIYVMSADGTDTQRLTSTREDDLHPTWSPDGSQIAFERGTPGDIYVMDADGSGARAITAGPATEAQPAWSPDGRAVAYVRRAPGTTIRELWLVQQDGSRPRALTSLEAVSYSPAWSPDGARIAFSTDVDNTQFDIYTVGSDGKGLRRVTVTNESSFEPSWSPDATTIAFSEGGAIFTRELDQDVPNELTDPSQNDSSPAWNPVPAGEEE